MPRPTASTHAPPSTGVRIALALLSVIAVAAAIGAPLLVAPLQAALLAGAAALVAVFAAHGAMRQRAADTDAPAQAHPVPGGGAAGLTNAAQRELETLRTMQRDLIAAKQTAEAATMAKGEFLATMSHEIRTPLNGIVPLLDLLLSTPLQPDQREYLDTAHRSAHELLRIVDDILDYSKLEASKLELENVGINIKELVDSVAMLMEGSATAKGLRLAVAIDPSVRLAVRGDPVRLRQILTNLVSNAIKFTERGSVTIQIGKRGESRTHYEIVFAVRDTGIGLSTEAAAKLFQPFSQADASTTRLYGGTGLGLVICKRLVDLMNGKIGVRSEPGRGSLFWFNVPLLKAIGDIRVRRDLNGARALVLSADEPFARRIGSLLGNLGVSHVPSPLAPDALNKLRASATMNERWGYEVLVVDADSMRAAAASILRNVLRDPNLDHLRILVWGSDESVQDLRDGTRTATLSTTFDERELRTTLHALLGVDDAPVARDAPLFGGDVQAVPATATTSPPRRLSGHVLLVEDNPVNLQVARRLTSLLGLDVDVAEDGRIALERIASTRPDLVLMDCQMPVMDGYAATRARRALEAERGLPRLPIIAMSANAMVGDREKCLAAGMDDYLTKPLDRRLLETTLSRWLPIAADTGATAIPTPVAPPAPAPSMTAMAIDEAIVRDLVDVMGDDFGGLVQVFLEDAPRLIGSLRSAALRGDIDTFGATAHSLKSSSANLGALPLAELARDAEQATREGREIDLGASAQAIEGAFERAREAYRALGF